MFFAHGHCGWNYCSHLIAIFRSFWDKPIIATSTFCRHPLWARTLEVISLSSSALRDTVKVFKIVVVRFFSLILHRLGVRILCFLPSFWEPMLRFYCDSFCSVVKRKNLDTLGFLLRRCKDRHRRHQCALPDTTGHRGGCYRQALEFPEQCQFRWGNSYISHILTWP